MTQIKRDKAFFHNFVKECSEGKLMQPISFYAEIDGVYKCVTNIAFNCRVETFILEKDAIKFCNSENKLD